MIMVFQVNINRVSRKYLLSVKQIFMQFRANTYAVSSFKQTIMKFQAYIYVVSSKY